MRDTTRAFGPRLVAGAWLFLLMFLTAARIQAQTTNLVATNYVGFNSASYLVDENAPGYAVIIVTRSGDDLASICQVEYVTTDGTAIGGIDYRGDRGTLTFFPFETTLSFFVLIFDNFQADGDRTVNMQLKNAAPEGSTLLTSRSNAVLTIIDDETHAVTVPAGQVEISTGNSIYYSVGDYYIHNEEWRDDKGPPRVLGAEVTFIRKGGTRGKIMVDWSTTTNVLPYAWIYDPYYFGLYYGGMAVPGIDYVPTNGTVTFDDFQMSTNVVIKIPPIANPILLSTNFLLSTNYYALFPPPKTFGVMITNVRAWPEEDANVIQPTLGPTNTTVRKILIADDTAGFGFYRRHYRAGEGAGVVRIAVRRSYPIDQSVSVRYAVNPRDILIVACNDSGGGDHKWNTWPLEPSSDYAAPFLDFAPPGSDLWRQILGRTDCSDAILKWDANDIDDKVIEVPILQDSEAEFEEDMFIMLWKQPGETDGFINRSCSYATLSIAHDDQPAGAADRDFNKENDPLTYPPHNLIPGANNTVQALAVQPDGKTIIGGDFTAFNTTPRNRIARVNTDGQIDNSFNPGLGADGFVSALALQRDGRVIVGGGFTSINGTSRYKIARLLPNGQVDPSFNPGIGADDAVRGIAVQSDGKIIIGGDFNYYNGTNRYYLARLNSDGSLDATFDPGDGPNGPVYSIALGSKAMDIKRQASGGQAEDRYTVDTGSRQGILTVNYDFLMEPDSLKVYQGAQLVYDSGLINGQSSVDIPYGPAVDTRLTIVINEGNNSSATTLWRYSLLIKPVVDDLPVIGGNFTAYNGVQRNFIARLNPNGSLDASFDPGTGADDVIHAVAKQGNKVVIGGAFTTIDLRKRRGVARLNEDGGLDTTFDTGSGTDNTVYSLTVQEDGKAIAGGIFRSFNTTRRIGLLRLNHDGTLDTSFMDTAYNQFAGVPGPLDPDNPLQQENFILAMNTYRQTNQNVLTVTNILTTGETNFSLVTNYTYSDYVFVGGSFKRVGGGNRRDDIRSRLNFTRLIGGETPGPGNFDFANPEYTIDENGSKLYVTITRTNGSLSAASVKFGTLDPPSGPGIAIGGSDYSTTNRTLAWLSTYGGRDGDDRQVSSARMGPNNNSYTTNRAVADFDTYQNGFPPPRRGKQAPDDDIFVTILDDSIIEGDETFNFKLTDAANSLFLGGVPIPVGVALGKADARVTIVDNDFVPGTLGFSTPTYYATESGRRANITVTRTGGSVGEVSVDYITSDGTGKALKDYLATKGKLTFASGQTSNSFNIPIIDNNIAELDRTVSLTLSNPAGFPITIPLASRLDPNRSNAVLVIIDDDFAPGRLSFEQPNYTAGISDGMATVVVRRNGGSLGDLKVSFSTGDGTAFDGVNYTATNGVLNWVDGDISPRIINIPVFNTFEVGTNRVFNISLFNSYVNNQYNTNALGQAQASITIANDNSYGRLSFSQTGYNVDELSAYAIITVLRKGGLAGALNVNYWTTNVSAVPGVNYLPVSGLLSFREGEASKTFIVPLKDDGILTGDRVVTLSLSNAVVVALGTNSPSVMGNPANSTLTIIDRELSRIPAGSPDRTFVSAEGTDDYIYGLALQADGNLVLGGDFSTMNGITRKRMARINPDGSLDYSFNPFLGPNGSVRSIAVQPDNRILISGFFTSYNNTNRNYITRLNVDGTIDPTFNPGSGADNPVHAIVLQGDNKIVVVGDFASFNGLSRRYIARLNPSGMPDLSFNPGAGANGTIYSAAMQTDGKIVIGGDFTLFNNTPQMRIARLNPNGSLDASFNAGAGPNAAVRALAIQSDGKIVIGGLFTNVSGATLRSVARLNADGAIDPEFQPGAGADNAVYAIALQIDGKIILGGDFTHFGGINRSRITRLNPDGTPDPTINIGSGANGFVSSMLVQPDRKIVLVGGFTEFDGEPHLHIARIHGGAMADSGSLEFSSPAYSVVENQTNVVVTVRREGGTIGSVAVDYLVASGGTAKSGADYTEVSGNLTFKEGETFQSFKVPIIDDSLVEFDETVFLSLTNFAGALIGNQPTATITIVSDDSQFDFSAPTYSVNENAESRTAVITVLRTGATNNAVSVDFATVGITAVTNINFLPATGTLQFGVGETLKTFSIPIVNNNRVEGSKTLSLLLLSPSQGGVLGQASAVLTIVDDDFAPGELNFSAANYYVDENGGAATITVNRSGGSSGIVLVNYATRDGSAQSAAGAGQDYYATNGVLAFADGETSKSFQVRVLDDLLMEDDETLDVLLTNPSGGAVLGTQGGAILTIVNNNYIYGNFVLATNKFVVNENGGNATVTVLRKNGTAGQVKVDYATSDGTAISGLDYSPARGTLIFANGETSKSFQVPIVDNLVVESNEFFNVNLVNPVGGATLGRPRSGIVSIQDDDLMVNFESDAYVVKEDEGKAVITVTRTAGGPSTLSVNYATVAGTARDGVNYSAVAGKLTFGVNEYAKNLTIPIINNDLIEGNKTVLVVLSNPTDNALLGTNSATTITILDDDGSLIIPAGSALTVEEFQPANGVIDPGEVVTVNFGLRNIGKRATTNLVVTLVASNGVAQAAGPQTYGVLLAGGPLVARPFTFKALGATGSVITVTMQLKDDAVPLGTVSFNFTLGSSTAEFANGTTIFIRDHNSALPYPSTISVSGMPGRVSKVVVTLNRLAHGYPDDIDVLLVSPTGESAILMSDTGGGNSITNVTLVFDDAAGKSLSDTNQIGSGTYKPTNINLGDIFADPAPTGPYGAAMSAFKGINPNGTWSLFVMDDSPLDLGRIAGGWNLSLTTVKDLNTTADLAVEMTPPSPQSIMLGGTIHYTLLVTNAGPMTATGVTVTNDLPAGLTLVSARPSQGNYVYLNGQLIINFLLLTNNTSASADIVLLATNSGSKTITLRTGATQVDLNPSNDDTSAVVIVLNPEPPRVGSGVIMSNGQFQFTLSGVAGQQFVIEASTDLKTWIPVLTNSFLTGTYQFNDTATTSAPYQFYRARSLP